MNSRINAVKLSEAQGETKEMLNKIQSAFGAVPNIFRVLANSETALASLLAFSGTLSKGKLDRQLAERIAILAAVENGCQYCLAAHSHIAKTAGLSQEEIELSKTAESSDSKVKAALEFSKSMLQNKGQVSDAEFAKVKEQGFSDAEILEIVANVALNVFTNYINNVTKTEIDF